MRIYVPLDGSPESERALVPAALLLRGASTGELVLGRIVRDYLSIPDVFSTSIEMHPQFTQDECSAKLHYLQDIAQRSEWKGIPVRVIVGLGEPAQMACEQAQSVQADLIIMTTHSRTGLSHAILGSYAEEVVYRSSLPILLIRSEGEIFPDPAQIPTPRMLVPLDGTAQADAILSAATRLARALQARLWLVSVLPEETRMHEPQLVTLRDEYLTEHRQRLEQQGINAEQLIAWGEPASALLEVCAQQHIDLIAMATHARRGLEHLVLGSIANDLLHHTALPILLVHKE